MVDCTGEQIGNYRMVQLLGSGGFADVYLGQQVYLDSPAAITHFLLTMATHP